MSDHTAEIAPVGRSEIQTQSAQTPQFDALQLHMEGAGRAPAVVPENNLTAAVFNPTENSGAHLIEAQYRGGGGHFDGRGYDHGRYYGPGVGAAVAGALLYDTLVAPYAYPGYGPSYAAPTVCEPQYYGPPVCYSAPLEPIYPPVVPFYGRERFYEPRRYYEGPEHRWRR